MKILAIDTSCDETAAAVTQDLAILSNIIWSQASAHAKFGGVMPSLAQRMHEERIDFVIHKALGIKHKALANIDAIAVTIGPGLSIALLVGINKAKELAIKYKKPLIPINHVEAHLLSSFAKPLAISHQRLAINFPTLGLCLSGGNTILVKIKDIGEYEVLAQTDDDALGEALDKAARLLGFGYPGAVILEKFAKLGNPKKYSLPIPLIEDKIKNRFSYSGLKSAFVRLFNTIKNPTKQDLYDLSASFQNAAFKHVEEVVSYWLLAISQRPEKVASLLFGGGVANNIEIRKRLRKLCKKFGISLHLPYSKKLLGDNAAMIGIAAYFKANRNEFIDPDKVDRVPNLKL
ncbi:MAG: tRNA (adenosine(37)-N6)-threonylcarbamoyltransferase complex transferase subunit TsaD [Patescibacteria group bacterium]